MSGRKQVFDTKRLALTAMLLALCVMFQCLKSLSVYLTGSAVNAILVLATLYCGLAGGLCIAVLAPVAAALLGATPIINMIPLMIVVIAAGNAVLVVLAALLKRKLVVGLAFGSVGKAAFLWLLVWYVMLPVFGGNIPEAMQAAMRVTFSVTQLVTAAIGSAIACLIHWRIAAARTAKDN